MSIIQEALKKAEVNVDTPALHQPSAPIPRKIEEIVFSRKAVANITSRKPAFNRKQVILLIGAASLLYLTYCAVGLLYGIISSPNKTTTAVTQEINYRTITPNAPETLLTSPGQSAPNNTILTTAGYPRLTLNGIMYREDGPQAIMNNSIVGEGDFVKGARILKINQKNVVLIYNNTEITINLK